MASPKSETLAVRSTSEAATMRQMIRSLATELSFSVVDQTKLLTAASELARNMMDYGGGGTVTIELLSSGLRSGVRVTFRDAGPGIADIERAMTDGFSTGKGLGLGLGGSRRLVDEFEIRSEVGKGTEVRVTKWK